MLQRAGHHHEFVVGLDWSLFERGVVCSGSWDHSIVAWNVDQGPPPAVPRLPKQVIQHTKQIPSNAGVGGPPRFATPPGVAPGAGSSRTLGVGAGAGAAAGAGAGAGAGGMRKPRP